MCLTTEIPSKRFLINSYAATFMLESPLFTGVVENKDKNISYGKLRTSYVINSHYNDKT